MQLTCTRRIFFRRGEKEMVIAEGDCFDDLTIPEGVWGAEEYERYSIDGKEVSSSLLRRMVFGTRLLDRGELARTDYARYPDIRVTVTIEGAKPLVKGDILVPVLDYKFIADYLRGRYRLRQDVEV